MGRRILILLCVVALAGCATTDLMRSAEETGDSKTVSDLDEITTAPATYNNLFIDQTGTSKRISVLNLMRSLESTLDNYAIATENASTAVKTAGATCVLNDGSGELDDGTQCVFSVPFKHTLTKIALTTDETSGSLTIDVWADVIGGTTGLANITDADSLFDTATEPTISNAATDRYVSTTSFDSGEAAGDAETYYIVNVDSCETITEAHVIFTFTRAD